MAASSIPTVDLSPFFTEGDENGKKKALEAIGKACSEYGFFQIVNHGVPIDLMQRAFDLSKAFFNCPSEEKLAFVPKVDAPIPAGYKRQPEHSADKNEYLMMCPPGTSFNVIPTNPPELRKVLEEMFTHLSKAGSLVETIVNECLGLPPNYLKEYINHDKSSDIMAALHYFPASEAECNGMSAHQDGNCITFVIQDQTGGLEVWKDGQWIPIPPIKGTLVVNIGDILQVMSNNKLKSASHRVVRQPGKNRYSFAFFYNVEDDKWVEPLPEFTNADGEAPKYRGFVYKDYQKLRIRNKTHPPADPKDVVDINYYAVPA